MPFFQSGWPLYLVGPPLSFFVCERYAWGEYFAEERVCWQSPVSVWALSGGERKKVWATTWADTGDWRGSFSTKHLTQPSIFANVKTSQLSSAMKGTDFYATKLIANVPFHELGGYVGCVGHSPLLDPGLILKTKKCYEKQKIWWEIWSGAKVQRRKGHSSPASAPHLVFAAPNPYLHPLIWCMYVFVSIF